MTSEVTWLFPGHLERADVAVIIVSWNVKERVLANLDALHVSVGSISAEVILVDNASSDGTVEAVRAAYPWVRVIANTYNAGFSQANTQGMIAMHTRHALLLNPDMRVEPDALQKTVEYLDTHADVGVASGILRSAEGGIVESVRRFPDIFSQCAILLKIPHLVPGIIAHYLMKGFDYTQEQQVDSVRGSYFAIQERCLESLGGLDTRYFIWFEEVDYCKRVTTHGWKVMHVPTLHATDYVGQSFKKQRFYWKQKQMSRSLLQYMQKWHPGWRAWIIMLLRPFVLLFAWILDQVRT